MPEPIRREEDVNRAQSLCLFKVPGITSLNRCSNCPGAARSSLQHRRCPLDVDEPNIFRPPVDPVNLSASSSGKGKEPETELIHQAQKISLDAAGPNILNDPVDPESRVKSLASSSGKETELLLFQAQKLSLADPSASGSSSATLAVPSQDVGSKRKVDDVRRGNYEKEINSKESKNQSIPEWLMTKPLKQFAEATEDFSGLYPNKRFLHQLMRVSENDAAGSASSSTFTAVIPVPLIVSDVPGVFSCCEDMQIEGP